jgi:hypothetical protein
MSPRDVRSQTSALWQGPPQDALGDLGRSLLQLDERRRIEAVNPSTTGALYSVLSNARSAPKRPKCAGWRFAAQLAYQGAAPVGRVMETNGCLPKDFARTLYPATTGSYLR